jgi:hypothetical protein
MSVRSESCWRRKVAKKKRPKMTPEDEARRDETQRMVRERIAYHDAKAREQEQQQEEARRRAGE